MLAQHRRRRGLPEHISGYLYLLPVILLVGVFVLYPAIQSVILSFVEWPGYGDYEFVGFDNYIRMFAEDRYFWAAMQQTLYFALVATGGTVIIGFVMALLVDIEFPMWKAFRFVFFLPVTFSAVAVGLIMSRVFGPNGLVNAALEAVNLSVLKINWLGREMALTTISLILVWQYSGFTMIFFLAGLKNIPTELYDAATVDGASLLRRVFSITIPLLKNVFAVVLLVQLIFSFKAFALFWIMTQGGPAGATEVLGTFIYRGAFARGLIGYSSASAVVVILISMAFSVVYATILGYGPQAKKKAPAARARALG